MCVCHYIGLSRSNQGLCSTSQSPYHSVVLLIPTMNGLSEGKVMLLAIRPEVT